eukprot:TRINITY_DN51178_c0_g1_i1.p1 TRINITY_DN51178_c0_g1~~TRINITY_DN51178_c0_g1_i1.p1  ORF type:complete len:290 (+),score=47.65 TRINITY_DN51178_c0_g1_i1:74-871(+)
MVLAQQPPAGPVQRWPLSVPDPTGGCAQAELATCLTGGGTQLAVIAPGGAVQVSQFLPGAGEAALAVGGPAVLGAVCGLDGGCLRLPPQSRAPHQMCVGADGRWVCLRQCDGTLWGGALHWETHWSRSHPYRKPRVEVAWVALLSPSVQCSGVTLDGAGAIISLGQHGTMRIRSASGRSYIDLAGAPRLTLVPHAGVPPALAGGGKRPGDVHQAALGAKRPRPACSGFGIHPATAPPAGLGLPLGGSAAPAPPATFGDSDMQMGP